MKRLNVIQGSQEWKDLRAKYPCASEAPVIMGASRHMTRGELLRLKAAGMEREFSDYVQRMVLDKGHEVEAPARAITERQIGEKLYPITAVDDDGEYLASLDGCTMAEDWLMEHKQWSEELAACIRAGATEFPDGQEWQLEQQLLVAKDAEGVIFVCSDGTEGRRVQMEYRRVPGRAEQLRAATKQFYADLAAGVAPPAPPKAVAQPLEMLPAVNVRMEGALKVVSNLDALEPVLRAFIDRIPAKPSTDQDFATTDAACKALKKLEEELDRSEAAALGSLDNVAAMQRLKATLHKLARDTRLQREKLVEARKLEIRTEEINRGKQALAEVIAGYNATIGKPYMPAIAADFAVAIKGLRTVQSVRDAVDQELARAKLAGAEVFQRIQANMATLRDLAKDHASLFADTATLVLKAQDDCRAQIEARIAAHKAEQERKAAELAERERARIRAEEEARARAQAQREQQERQQAEDALIASFHSESRRIEFDSVPYIQKAITGYESTAKDWENDPRERVRTAYLAGGAYLKDRLEAAERRQREEIEARERQQREEQEALERRQSEAAAAPAVLPSGAAGGGVVGEGEDAVRVRFVETVGNVHPLPTRAPAPAASSAPTLKLRDINERLDKFTVTEAQLAALGFPVAATERGAKLYHAEDWPAILDAIIDHATDLREQCNEQEAA